MKTVAEVTIQPNGTILIKRSRKNNPPIKAYTPTHASFSRIIKMVRRMPQTINNTYFFRV